MAGAITTEGRGTRRALDFELNMVPMIDLLMVTISFLLLTAVWTHFSRIESEAMVPGAIGPSPPATEQRLHVDMSDPARIALHWDIGRTVIRTAEVPRHEVVTVDRGARQVRFPELQAALGREWGVAGSHRAPTDASFDELVLHTGDDASYAEIVGAMDAAYGVRRACAGGKTCPAFRVVFASR